MKNNNRSDMSKTGEPKLITTINKDDFIALYKDAGWWCSEYEKDLSFIDNIISGSFLFVAVFDDTGKAIAMGRVLSDGCSDAYIQDVVVLCEYRKQGIGGEIISFLIKQLQKQGIDWIGLIGEPGTEAFYSHLGFKTMNDYIPMKLEK